MDLRSFLLLFACVVFTMAMGICAYMFIQKKNYVLGGEWAVMTLSGANLVIWAFTGSDWQWDFMLYLDAFSRVAGMNLLVVFGFLAVSHNYTPSLRIDAWAFLITGLLAVLLLYVEFMDPLRPYVFFAVFYLFLPFLLYLTWKIYALGNSILALHLAVATALLAFIHSIADFYKIPGEDTNLLYNYGFMALMTWAYSYTVLYRAYVSWERHAKVQREYSTHDAKTLGKLSTQPASTL